VDAQLTALGFELGEQCEDELFRLARLPEGWTIERAAHAMYSHVIDADGYQRCTIFYKAAFYDRSATISINGVPCTAAQSDAINDLYSDPDFAWVSSGRERDGANYVVTMTPQRVWKLDQAEQVKRRRLTVAPDGQIVSDDIFEVSIEQAQAEMNRA
jgi:hypothetical protein